MKTSYYILISFIFIHVFSFSQNNRKEKIILNSLKAQENEWNKGNIEGYMAYYWISDSLKFIGKSGITYGWKNTLEHYKISYPDKKKMGMLTFSEIKFESLKRNIIMVTGRWELARENDNLNGYYSLLWKKTKGKWVIISDHTS